MNEAEMLCDCPPGRERDMWRAWLAPSRQFCQLTSGLPAPVLQCWRGQSLLPSGYTCLEGVIQARACVCGWLQTRPWECASDSIKHRHTPGGSWKRPTTLFSGVLKKAAAIELYSPSAQKSCKVGREYRPVGWGSPGLESIRHQPQGRMGLSSCLREGRLRFSGPYLQPPVLQSLSSHCSGRRTRVTPA